MEDVDMSAEVKFIIPKDGQIVRDPISKQALPIEGLEKPWIGPEGRYWRRREIDGSIQVFENNYYINKHKHSSLFRSFVRYRITGIFV